MYRQRNDYLKKGINQMVDDIIFFSLSFLLLLLSGHNKRFCISCMPNFILVLKGLFINSKQYLHVTFVQLI